MGETLSRSMMNLIIAIAAASVGSEMAGVGGRAREALKSVSVLSIRFKAIAPNLLMPKP